MWIIIIFIALVVLSSTAFQDVLIGCLLTVGFMGLIAYALIVCASR